MTYLKWLLGEVSGGDDLIADFLVEDPEALKKVLDVIAEDIASLSRAVIEEAGAGWNLPQRAKYPRSTSVGSRLSSRHCT